MILLKLVMTTLAIMKKKTYVIENIRYENNVIQTTVLKVIYIIMIISTLSKTYPIAILRTMITNIMMKTTVMIIAMLITIIPSNCYAKR